jgi:hypothetical protein
LEEVNNVLEIRCSAIKDSAAAQEVVAEVTRISREVRLRVVFASSVLPGTVHKNRVVALTKKSESSRST